MTDFIHLPCKEENGSVNVVVESPKGSCAKLAFDPKRGVFALRRPLPLGVHYPHDWGFIPSTAAADGDPLDAMVLFDAPTFPGVVIPSVPIGVIRVTQRDKKGAPRVHNDRILAVPFVDQRYSDIADLPAEDRHQLEQFFLTVVSTTPKVVHIEGWSGAKAATKLIDAAARRYVSGKMPG